MKNEWMEEIPSNEKPHIIDPSKGYNKKIRLIFYD